MINFCEETWKKKMLGNRRQRKSSGENIIEPLMRSGLKGRREGKGAPAI